LQCAARRAKADNVVSKAERGDAEP